MPTWRDLTEEQLIALPTHRLYTVYRLMRKSHDILAYDHNVRGNEDNGFEEMEAKCTFVKLILDGRGHIEREKVADNYGQSERSYRGAFSWLQEDAKPRIHEGSIKNPEDAVGLQVFKSSKKPFKSKNVYNTVKAVTVNPHTHLVAFTFEEDESIVDAHICNLRKRKAA